MSEKIFAKRKCAKNVAISNVDFVKPNEYNVHALQMPDYSKAFKGTDLGEALCFANPREKRQLEAYSTKIDRQRRRRNVVLNFNQRMFFINQVLEKELTLWSNPPVQKKKIKKKPLMENSKRPLTSDTIDSVKPQNSRKIFRGHTFSDIKTQALDEQADILKINPDESIEGVYRSKTLLVPVIDKIPKPANDCFKTMPLLLHPGFSGFAPPEIISEPSEKMSDTNEVSSLHTIPIFLNKTNRRLSKIRHDSNLLFPKLQRLVDEYHGRLSPQQHDFSAKNEGSPMKEKAHEHLSKFTHADKIEKQQQQMLSKSKQQCEEGVIENDQRWQQLQCELSPRKNEVGPWRKRGPLHWDRVKNA
ncbi:DgyrCDS4291 [Dimorphilus gyrociliatus]|uniref:DgyrCDS4291 n=1 Tax=Dimorphilus gyrociliatus TaxID=2664684 RepID=A0A7I8VG25_9ANNE|nr:DgyrCDS4291 [Dimorphilus gyrociliatus]